MALYLHVVRTTNGLVFALSQTVTDIDTVLNMSIFPQAVRPLITDKFTITTVEGEEFDLPETPEKCKIINSELFVGENPQFKLNLEGMNILTF